MLRELQANAQVHSETGAARAPSPAKAMAALALGLAVVGAGLPPAITAQEQSRSVRSEKIVVTTASESGEPSEGAVRVQKKVVFVDGEGKLVELEGEGDGNSFSWQFEGDVLHLDGGDGDGADGSRVRVWLSALGLGNGYLGVELTPLTDSLRRHFGVEEGRGILVAEVAEGSPAHQAGLRVGDIVTRASGKTIESPHDLTQAVRSKEKDQQLDLELFRDGHPLSLTATVGERERPRVKLGRHGSHLRLEHLAGEDDDGVVVVIDEAVGRLRQYFEGDEWKTRLRLLESNEWTSIEDRMREVQRQLRQLEKKLDAAQPEDR